MQSDLALHCPLFRHQILSQETPSRCIKSLPNDNSFDWIKFKPFADNKLNVAKSVISVFDRVENIVGKGENAGYQPFLLFPQYFQKASFSGSLKVGILW